ncbi:type 4a pilus biogenesis protein PilO [bacterium]|nr:type 4a pilus biogenesis protein PilO [bacterium]
MKRSIFIPIFLFLSVVTFSFFTLPEHSLYLDLQEKIKEQALQISQGEQYFTNLRKAFKTIQSHPENLEKVESAIAKTPSLPPLLDYLEQSASQSGAVLKSIGIESFRSKGGFPNQKIKKFSLGLELRGDYESLKKFASLLEKSSRLVSIENVTVGGYKDGLFDFKLLIESYYFL